MEEKDALYLLEVLSILYYCEPSPQVFETAWKTSQAVCIIKADTNGKIDFD